MIHPLFVHTTNLVSYSPSYTECKWRLSSVGPSNSDLTDPCNCKSGPTAFRAKCLRRRTASRHHVPPASSAASALYVRCVGKSRSSWTEFVRGLGPYEGADGHQFLIGHRRRRNWPGYSPRATPENRDRHPGTGPRTVRCQPGCESSPRAVASHGCCP